MGNVPGRTTAPRNFIGPPSAEYLTLRPTKAPISWETYDLGELEDSDKHVGIKMTEPWVVVDIDAPEQAVKLLELVIKEGIKCRVMQTTKGMHFWFKTTTPVKNSVKTMTGIGIYADYRSWGKNAQVCVKLDGQWREWVLETEWDDIEELPKWLRPLKQDKWKFFSMGDGDGRNAALFEYQVMLSDRAYSAENAREVIRMINTYILETPLPKAELDTICRPAAYPEPKVENPKTGEIASEDAPWFVTNKNGTLTFKHALLANKIVRDMHSLSYHGRLYAYQDGYYQPSDNDILKKIIKLYPGSKIAQRAEVVKYLQILNQTDVGDTEQFAVNLLNGRLDIRTKEMTPHSPEHIDFQRVNATLDLRCHDRVLDDMMLKVFCDDYALLNLFEEMVGYCLTRNCKFQKMFIFSGEGANGKSTVIKMLNHFFGEQSVSALSLQDLNDKFKMPELENRLANLGDDIPSLKVRDSSMMKKLVSGESISVERKNQDPFVMHSYAKLIFSTNKMPSVDDQSHGLGRRLCILPFDAMFSPGDKDYDVDIEDKILTPHAMSYLLNMGIRGYRRLVKRGKFTQPERVTKATEAFRVANSNVLTWFTEEDKTAESFLGVGTKAAYQEYRLWCESSGCLPQKKIGITSTIIKTFKMQSSCNRKINGGQDRVFELHTS